MNINLLTQRQGLQELPKPHDNAADFGNIIGGALQGLAHNKIKRHEARNKERFLVQGGLNPDFARELSNQPDETIHKVLAGLEGFGAQAPQQQQQVQSPGQVNNVGDAQQLFQQQQQQQNPQQQFNQQEQSTGVVPKGTAARLAREQQIAQAQASGDFKEAQKESKTYYGDLAKAAKASKDNNLRLDKMESLINTGKLTHPLWSSLIKTVSHGVFGFGIDLNFLQSPESQEFEKLSTDFLSNVKDIFGGTVTNSEYEQYLKTIPNLTQSNEGKKAVIDNLKSMNDAKLLKENTARKIIKENGGMVPANLEFLVDEQAAPELEKLASKFKSIIHEKVASTKPTVLDLR